VVALNILLVPGCCQRTGAAADGPATVNFSSITSRDSSITSREQTRNCEVLLSVLTKHSPHVFGRQSPPVDYGHQLRLATD
jgi:hypothetical protein